MNRADQAREALGDANRIRIARAQLKRKLHSRETSLADVLRAPIPEWLANEKLMRLLRALPSVGPDREARLLKGATVRSELSGRRFKAEFGPTQPVGDLTLRQRRLLADELEASYYKVKP